MVVFLYPNHKATQSRISHNERAGKRLQDTASRLQDYCTCTMSLDFTGPWEKKSRGKKICPQSTDGMHFPQVLFSKESHHLYYCLKREKSFQESDVPWEQCWLLNVCIAPSQQQWTWAYGSWEDSCLILWSPIVNRMATCRPASLAEYHSREKLYYLYTLMFYQEKRISGISHKDIN